MSVSISWESINKSDSLFHTQFVLDLFFLSKQFQSHRVCEVFPIQKSKSCTNLNPKEEKQEQAIGFPICREKYLGCNLSLGQFFWGFSSGLFIRGAIMHASNHPKGNFPRRKSSRGKFFGSNYLWGNHPRGNYLGDNNPRAIIQEAIFIGSNCPRDNYPVENFPRGQFSSGAIIRRTIIQWKIFLGGNFHRGQLSKGQLSSGKFSLGAIARRAIIRGGQYSSRAIVRALL